MIVAIIGDVMHRVHDNGQRDRVLLVRPRWPSVYVNHARQQTTAAAEGKQPRKTVRKQQPVPSRPLFRSQVEGLLVKTAAVIGGAKRIATNAVEVVPWEKFYAKAADDFVTYEIKTTPSVKNNQASVLAKVVASFYRKPSELRSWGSWKDGILKARDPYRVNFRIVMREKDVAFYLLLPRDKAGEILRKAEAIYHSGITINEVPTLEKLDPAKTFACELQYRKHDIFSLATDKDNNYPLPSLLTAVRTLEGEDVAVFDVMLEPYSRFEWYRESKKAHSMLEKGYVPDNRATTKVFRLLHEGFEKVRYELLELTRFTKAQKEALKEWKKEQGQAREAAQMLSSMAPATKRKQGEEVLRAWMRIAVQSEVKDRARDAAYTIANSWKDLSSDNELERVDVPAKWTARFVEAIETRKGFTIGFRTPKVSTDEAGKMLQLPGRSLIEEFPQIRNLSTREVTLPEELLQYQVKHIRVGRVTERGVKKLAVVPLEAYKLADGTEVKLKYVYDALCTGGFSQGKMGSGKSEGYGTVTAYDMVMAGFTVVILDTADGQVLRSFLNALPEDYPDEKLHALNLDNKAWPMPLDWSDVYGRELTAADGDDELAALIIREKLTARFVGYIDSLKDTGETFSDRMRQYLTSALRAITVRTGWSFLDLELALTSPAYREELLGLDAVKEQPDVVRDLITLQDLAADGGKERGIVDPILARLKVLSSSQFTANMFFQPPKLDAQGKPILDFRRIFDNPEGGYGHVVVVQASFDAWQELQGLLLGFIDDKINFNVYSRIDITQDQRKPILKWIDEPHKIKRHIEDRAAETAVEFRKYRCKALYTNHAIEQLGKAADALMDGGAQITSYKTERLSELQRFAHVFKPYDDAKALYEALPDKHVAINKVRLPSGKDAPAFIAEMQAPPAQVKDRSYAWQKSAEKYGRPWKEVRDTIQQRRAYYAEADAAWHEDRKPKKESKRTAK